MDEGFMFLLGMSTGGLMMLFAILRILTMMHGGEEQNRWRR